MRLLEDGTNEGPEKKIRSILNIVVNSGSTTSKWWEKRYKIMKNGLGFSNNPWTLLVRIVENRWTAKSPSMNDIIPVMPDWWVTFGKYVSSLPIR